MWFYIGTFYFLKEKQIGITVIYTGSNTELSRLSSCTPLLVAGTAVRVSQGRHSLTVAYLEKAATTQHAGSCLEFVFDHSHVKGYVLSLLSACTFCFPHLPLLSCLLTFIFDTVK